MPLLNNDFIKLGLIIVGALVLVYLVNMLSQRREPVKNDGNLVVDLADKADKEQAENYGLLDKYSMMEQMEGEADEGDTDDGLKPGEAVSLLGTGFDGLSHDQLKHACFPIDRELTADDLLPGNEFASWSDMHPSGAGALEQKNFLHAGHHIGINTVGQSLRNANHNLRSDPPNPQLQVSPWIQTTIGPDMTRRPLEIGNCS